MITTSVGLTPENKNTIKELFHPYIKGTTDILGKDDLNNLLSMHNDIELKYYKLWLSGTNILEKVLHSKIYNQSTSSWITPNFAHLAAICSLYLNASAYTE